MSSDPGVDAERRRLEEDARRERNWKRWGPYLADRQWGTVREDYSARGEAWDSFPHDQARSRAYRWGEDGLLGIADRECRLCFALALWNGRDPILKERLFGLSGPEGNHGEDVKELYYFLDSTPTHSYLKALYKYPQGPFPYALLVDENRRRGVHAEEFELLDTGIFNAGRYFDVLVEYAKVDCDDILVRISASNRGPEAAPLHVLPTLWFRNTWAWGRTSEGYWAKPRIQADDAGGAVASALATHASLGTFRWEAFPDSGGAAPDLLFCDNETNTQRLYGLPGARYPKDAFHSALVEGRTESLNPERIGTKAAAHYRLAVPAGQTAVLKLRLSEMGRGRLVDDGETFDAVFSERIAEADAFYRSLSPPHLRDGEREVMRQAYAGLLWNKQYYHCSVKDWLEGDPAGPPPPPERRKGRNHEWTHLYNRDVLSMPDGWEYPWYAMWDLAFHMIPFCEVDPQFAKEQLQLVLREWYMHPNGQLPAYEWAFGDVNPPVHAWACWRVYKKTGPRGQRDTLFLRRVFHKLLLNFTWWVNRKDIEGKNLFAGGFLGLDNVGLFDRSKPLPLGGQLAQADGTAWMAFFCTTMLSIALELAHEDPAYEDIASKFFEHFVAIVDAMNAMGDGGLWDEQDGFYYDQLIIGSATHPVRLRSMVGLIPLFAAEILDDARLDRLPGFKRRMHWFLENRPELGAHVFYRPGKDGHGRRLLTIAPRDRLERMLRYLVDEAEFLSPHGIRSLSRVYRDRPYVIQDDGQEYRVDYGPGNSETGMFGGNSNWRGPVWFPTNYLLVEALERYHHFYGDELKVECPARSGQYRTLRDVAHLISARLFSLFVPDAEGNRPCHGRDPRYARDPHFKDLVLFYEYFHGDDGRGLGASHQTGWTALAVQALQDVCRHVRR